MKKDGYFCEHIKIEGTKQNNIILGDFSQILGKFMTGLVNLFQGFHQTVAEFGAVVTGPNRRKSEPANEFLKVLGHSGGLGAPHRV